MAFNRTTYLRLRPRQLCSARWPWLRGIFRRCAQQGSIRFTCYGTSDASGCSGSGSGWKNTDRGRGVRRFIPGCVKITNAMKRLQPVIWMKGTFLSPQYLQTQDRFIESTLEFCMDALSFAPWGFKRLQINQDALDTGTFALTDAAGILPDGLIFDIPDSDPPPSPKLLVDCFEPDQKTLDVFLAIPHYRDRGLNVSIEQKKADPRFLPQVA